MIVLVLEDLILDRAVGRRVDDSVLGEAAALNRGMLTEVAERATEKPQADLLRGPQLASGPAPMGPPNAPTG